jgi:hypothetical protein
LTVNTKTKFDELALGLLNATTALYTPGVRFVAFARKVTVAGVVALVATEVSQGVFGGMDTEKGTETAGLLVTLT